MTLPNPQIPPWRRPGWQLRAYVFLTRLARPMLKRHLKKRVDSGKEDPERWQEKLGITKVARPNGPLVWMHAVGLGEVLALRGVAGLLHTERPDLNFLITSGTFAASQAISGKMPTNAVHQYLPLDSPKFTCRFLSHWAPDLAIWSEQDIWPGLVLKTHKCQIPQALINARMNDHALSKRRRFASGYRDLFARLSIISAQDENTSKNLQHLGARNVRVDGSIKPAGPISPTPTTQDPASAGFQWMVASSHFGDETIALGAHRDILKSKPEAKLILAPRFPERSFDVIQRAKAAGFSVSRSTNKSPIKEVHIIETLGDLDRWYDQVPIALIGGGFDEIQGHNPWEAAATNTAILHGPQVANFANDYEALDRLGAAICVRNATEVADAVLHGNHSTMVELAKKAKEEATNQIRILVKDLLVLLDQPG